MINLKQAIEIATKYFNSKGYYQINKLYETENLWIAFSQVEQQHARIGISISKTTGKIRPFYLPSLENFVILDNARLIDPRFYNGEGFGAKREYSLNDIIEAATYILRIPKKVAWRNCIEVPEINAFYFWASYRDCATVIISRTGEKLKMHSSMPYEKHLKAFVAGKRN